MSIARTSLTLEEFLALPEEKPALEYIDRVVVQKLAPQYEHSAVQSALLLLLAPQLAVGQRGRALTEFRFIIGARAYGPDLVVYRRGRLPACPPGGRMGEVRVPPDLAVEILSPGQGVAALAARCKFYVEYGVSLALLVDDHGPLVQLFRAGAPLRTYDRSTTIDLGAAVPGLQLDVVAVFAVLDAEPPDAG
jgi:Uma2 family endonuclease